MENAFKMIGDLVKGLTGILIGVIALGVVAGIVFGNTVIIGDVIGNLVALVEGLGGAGLVGLIVVLILVSLLQDNK